ncbi:snaclec 7-like [Chelmon rostratus]|uniref:snaclec 7-like n=1 Tax=Chelmon rostratus TaxID=109905 RepID=UPI001BEAB4C7|nr:snaclec 7-like [Chelmon rostratus]
MTVEGEKMTWESAQMHCRKSQTNLISLLSETDHLLARRVFQKVNITERVWIGLRNLDQRWMWVNGDSLVYEAWSKGDQDYRCPIWKRCGALTKDGLWENWDCQEKLNFICY